MEGRWRVKFIPILLAFARNSRGNLRSRRPVPAVPQSLSKLFGVRPRMHLPGRFFRQREANLGT